MGFESKQRLDALRRAVWSHYRRSRRDFAWRPPELVLNADGSASEPYHILVSEIMLQQTQAGSRTEGKYREFIKQFPTTRALSRAGLSDVYRLWQGLGYNRRAKALRDAAIYIEEKLKGAFPRSVEGLIELPGVGPYTAAAVYAFAFNKPAVLVETNIRTVFIHHLFGDREGVGDRELMPLIEATIPRGRSRDWYYALMDYGAALKKQHGNVSRRSRHYVRQSVFKGSNREIRGKVLKALLVSPRSTFASLSKELGVERDRLKAQLSALMSEGFIQKEGSRYRLS